MFYEELFFYTFVTIGYHRSGDACFCTLAKEFDVYRSFVVSAPQGKGHQVETAPFVLLYAEGDVVR